MLNLKDVKVHDELIATEDWADCFKKGDVLTVHEDLNRELFVHCNETHAHYIEGHLAFRGNGLLGLALKPSGYQVKVYKDFFGQELKLGDAVAFTEPGYRNLVSGKILSFTPQKVRVEYVRPGSLTNYLLTYLSEPDFLIKRP